MMYKKMKAVKITSPGAPEVLEIRECDVPVPHANEVLIRVAAAGVNRPDVAQRQGHYPAPAGVPDDIPGLEVAGTVVAIGSKVHQFHDGDKVCALVAGSGYAEYVSVPVQQCLPLPKGLGMVEAASLPETFFTVWNNIFDLGAFKRGETVLVHGGSSGIGVTAIQMIKAMGGKVIVTAGTKEKCDFCQSLGADLSIHYKKEDFADVIRKKFGKVDIVLDMIGGDYTPSNIRVLKPQGRLVIINAMKGRDAQVDLMQVMVKRLTITGSTLRSQNPEYKGKIAQNLLQHIWPLFPQQIQPVIHKVFPLEEAAAAHSLMESSKNIGKIVLKVV